MADQLDLINRDPNNINDHLKVAFEDVIAEPDGVHSIDCCWKCSYRSFTWAKTFWYNVLTVCCACPIACCWGLEFASITFDHVWHYTPCLRMFMIQCGIAQKFFGTCLQCCIGPICETCGLIFSNIVVKNA